MMHRFMTLFINQFITPLVKQARELGLKAESGLGMLLYQGVEAFEIWTGKKAPVDSMREVLYMAPVMTNNRHIGDKHMRVSSPAGDFEITVNDSTVRG